MTIWALYALLRSSELAHPLGCSVLTGVGAKSSSWQREHCIYTIGRPFYVGAKQPNEKSTHIFRHERIVTKGMGGMS